MVDSVGVLALQGAYQKHVDTLASMGVSSRLVRNSVELDDCSGLIIPGGESTTMSLLLKSYGMVEPIRQFAQEHPVMGVCAGMIMMATEVDDDRVQPLGLLPFKALRNHYGRQVHSFAADVTLTIDPEPFHAIFIRAPGVVDVARDCEVLGSWQDEPVMIARGRHLALSFHPELTDDNRVHAHWLSRFPS